MIGVGCSYISVKQPDGVNWGLLRLNEPRLPAEDLQGQFGRLYVGFLEFRGIDWRNTFSQLRSLA